MVSQLFFALLDPLADSCPGASEWGPFLLTFATPLVVSHGDRALKRPLVSHPIDLARRQTSPLKCITRPVNTDAYEKRDENRTQHTSLFDHHLRYRHST